MSSEATTLNNKRQRVTNALAAVASPPDGFTKWYFTGRLEDLMVKQPFRDQRTGKITAMRAWCRLCRTPFFVHLQVGSCSRCGPIDRRCQGSITGLCRGVRILLIQIFCVLNRSERMLILWYNVQATSSLWVHCDNLSQCKRLERSCCACRCPSSHTF